MPALVEDAVLQEYGNVFVGDDEGSSVDLGAVRNVRFRGEQTKVEVDSDNRGNIIDRIRLNGIIEFEWLEPASADNMENIAKGLVTKTIVNGTPVPIENESKTLQKNVPVFLDNKNGDGSEVPISDISTDPGAVSLVEGTDYDVLVIDGKTAVLLSDSYAITTESVVIDYTYTPAVSKKVSGGTSKTATPRWVRIVGPSADDPLKERKVTLEAAVVDSEILLPFVDVETAGDVGVAPTTLKNKKDALWEYEDTINTA